MKNATRLALLLVLSLLAACKSAEAPKKPPAPERFRDLHVGFLIVDGVYNTELMAPFDVFHHTVFHTSPGMRVFTVAPTSAPVTTFEGLRILPDYTFDNAPPIDVLVVPSAEHSMDRDLEDAVMIGWVRRTGLRARTVLSLCDGAFVLAKAGLLDGRDATTFPADIERFRQTFPAVDVKEAVSFVHDGPALTSAGGAKSYDAALYLCQKLYGRKTARGIAGGLCIDWDLDAVEHEVAKR
jgi:transcriptional regulator GlxA family with amidase domain